MSQLTEKLLENQKYFWFQVIELSLSYRFDLNQSVGESIDTLEWIIPPISE